MFSRGTRPLPLPWPDLALSVQQRQQESGADSYAESSIDSDTDSDITALGSIVPIDELDDDMKSYIHHSTWGRDSTPAHRAFVQPVTGTKKYSLEINRKSMTYVTWALKSYDPTWANKYLKQRGHEEELKRYRAIYNPGVVLVCVWFEDLRNLLESLDGKLNYVRHFEFPWDNLVRPEMSTEDSHLYSTDFDASEVFALLAKCKRLQTLTIKIDTFRLLHARPDGEWRNDQKYVPKYYTGHSSADKSIAYLKQCMQISGMDKLRKVRVKGKVKVEYTWRDDERRGPEPPGFLNWLAEGMKGRETEMEREERGMERTRAITWAIHRRRAM